MGRFNWQKRAGHPCLGGDIRYSTAMAGMGAMMQEVVVGNLLFI
jgi:hypothetical protein